MGILYVLLWALVGAASIAYANAILLGLFAASGLIGYVLALKGGRPFTDGTLYIASRWPGTNLLFPTQVAIRPTRVTRYKARVIGREEESIPIGQIASVKIKTRLLWSDVLIESTGGANPIVCHGHTNADAIAMKAAIEGYQQEHFDRPTAPLNRLPRYRQTDQAAASEPPPDPATSPITLLLTLYPPMPPGVESLHRWPAPLKRLRVNSATSADEKISLLLGLLQEGGRGSHVQVDGLNE